MQRLSLISSNFSTTQINNKKLIVIFGAPGVGKGTYTKMLMNDFGFNHISTGDQIRKIIKNSTSQNTYSQQIISKIKQIILKGGLVNDNIILQIMKAKIQQPLSKNGALLDGFPRTNQQLKSFLKIYPKINLVVNIKLRNDILIQKLLGRLTCQKCGSGYNTCGVNKDGYNMPPMLPIKQNICDKCGGNLIKRSDDKIQIIQQRMIQYQQKTSPLIKQFQRMGVLVQWQPKNGVKDYYQLKEIIKNTLK